MKLLVVGRVTDLAALTAKAATLQSSTHGPFDALFVCDLADAAGLASVVAATPAVPLPLPTWFLTRSDTDAAVTASAAVVARGTEASTTLQLTWLAGGDVATVAGLKVAWCDEATLSGAEDGAALPASVASLCDKGKELMDGELSPAALVDVLLTSAWTAAPTVLPAATSVTPTPIPAACSRLATALEPRYHFTPSPSGVYTQRAPYTNAATGVCTRLIAIAPFPGDGDGKGDHKNVHALNMVPAVALTLDVVTEAPAGTGPNPYVVEGGGVPDASTSALGTKRTLVVALGRDGGTVAPSLLGGGDGAGTKRRRVEGGAAVAATVGGRYVGGGTWSTPAPVATGANAILTPADIAALQAESDARALRGEQSFWRVDASGGRGRGRGRGGGPRPPPGPAAECWFCLASPHVEKHLVVSVATETYLALPKGGIDETHVLVVPVGHEGALATAPDMVWNETRQFLNALAALYAEKGFDIVAFERVLQNRRSEIPVHTHMQVIGVPWAMRDKLKDMVLQEGAFRQVPMHQLALGVDLKEAVETRPAATPAPAGGAGVSAGGGMGGATPAGDPAAPLEYLYMEVPDPSSPPTPDGRSPFVRLMHFIPPGARHPIQFARETLCRLLSRPDRVQWKDCATGMEAETKEATAFRASFAKHDFTLAL